jgi:hypothetical protein
MLAPLAIALLALSPSMAGPPNVAVHGSAAPVDYTQSVFLTGPATAGQCTNAAVTNDQAGTISVSRASSSYCQKDDGTYVLIDSNKLVVEADGLRTEPSSTNRVDYSEDIAAQWSVTNALEDSGSPLIANPVGTGNIYPFEANVAGGYVESPSFTISSTSAVLSLWTQGVGGGQTVNFILRDTTAGANRCTGSATAGVSWATMSARPSVSCTGLTSGNSHVVRFYPGGTGSTGTAYVSGVQVEPGRTVKTSYIPTAGAAVTRAADAVSMTITDNSARGCVQATIKATNPTSGERLFSHASDTLVINAVSQLYSGDGTNSVFTGGGASDITGRSVVVRAQWGGSTLSLSLDSGAATGSGSFDGTMGSGTTLYIGSNAGVAQYFHGWLKAIKVSTSSTGGCT